MSFVDALLLFLAAAGGGALNSVAGGGSFLTFPMLLFQGVSPIAANATSTVALWPGSLASASAYRRELGSSSRHLVSFSLASLLGGYIGAVLLLRTSDGDFRAAVPWLLLFATLLFAFGGSLIARFRKAPEAGKELPGTLRSSVIAVTVQLAISIYGGFFGGGIGIMMLAAFTLLGMQNIHAMNGLKNWLAVCINGVAVVTFIVGGAVLWKPALVMLTGAVVGGYGGAAGSRRVDPLLIRRFVIVLGLLLSVYFFASG